MLNPRLSIYIYNSSFKYIPINLGRTLQQTNGMQMRTPLKMKANAAKYLSDGSLMIGMTDRKTATASVNIGIIIGTLQGRGVLGCVRRRTIRQANAAPYITQMRNEANSMSASMSPTQMNRNETRPWRATAGPGVDRRTWMQDMGSRKWPSRPATKQRLYGKDQII